MSYHIIMGVIRPRCSCRTAACCGLCSAVCRAEARGGRRTCQRPWRILPIWGRGGAGDAAAMDRLGEVPSSHALRPGPQLTDAAAWPEDRATLAPLCAPRSVLRAPRADLWCALIRKSSMVKYTARERVTEREME